MADTGLFQSPDVGAVVYFMGREPVAFPVSEQNKYFAFLEIRFGQGDRIRCEWRLKRKTLLFLSWKVVAAGTEYDG